MVMINALDYPTQTSLLVVDFSDRHINQEVIETSHQPREDELYQTETPEAVNSTSGVMTIQFKHLKTWNYYPIVDVGDWGGGG